ncbi:DUF397 domain-containing protein [Nocardiopsis sp. HUAS JQ3]|uniref:DUF397 domain-containing protein n=1 Tax=Nocardiopsis sp. HUAS JQ3 TaxID=3061629 RepID=UPI0023A99015|nr:DUF397 domain-containing protein [Nocardiopsis sp. HUAS JQ3]WDZ90601.1 DUF397 domain-containing protein [Nocardiopsis sp. HUAS JQ3]
MTTEQVNWHKSSHSGSSGSCVEVAEGERVLVRDTQNRNLGHISFTPAAWGALLESLQAEHS